MTESHTEYGLQRPWSNTIANNSTITIGQLLDVFDSNANVNVWSVAQVIDIKDNQLKIHWYGWALKYDEWTNKHDQKLAPLQTHTLPMIPLLCSPKNAIPKFMIIQPT
eukprot:114772_1